MGLLDGLFGGDDSNQAMLAQLERNRALYNNVELPKYKEFVPELYNNESANYQLNTEDPVVKSKQLEALSKLSGLSSEGLSDADLAGFSKAREEGTQLARHGTEAALANAAQRGISGSGLEFAMRESANQEGAKRAQEAAQAQAAAAANQRGQYLQAYAQGLGNVRGQDYQNSAANTNVINQFNQANTKARNATNAANVEGKNEAFQYNQGLLDKNYQNQMGRANAMAGINNQQGQMTAAQQEADRRRRAGLTGLVGAGVGAALGGSAGAGVGYGVGSAVG